MVEELPTLTENQAGIPTPEDVGTAPEQIPEPAPEPVPEPIPESVPAETP